MTHLKTTILALAVATTASVAHADSKNPYAGGKVATTVDSFGDINRLTFYAGMPFNKNRGVEGELFTEKGENDLTSFGAGIYGFYRHYPSSLNLPVYFKSKLGYSYFSRKYYANGVKLDDTEGGISYGIGLGTLLSDQVSVEAEWTGGHIDGIISIGVHLQL